MRTFRSYLRAQTGRPDPVGDLARVAFGEGCQGGCLFTDHQGLVRHLFRLHPDLPDAVWAATRRALKEYRARGGRT